MLFFLFYGIVKGVEVEIFQGIFMKRLVLLFISLFFINPSAFADNLQLIICESNKAIATPRYSKYGRPQVIKQSATWIFYLDTINNEIYAGHNKKPMEVTNFNDGYVAARINDATYEIDRISGEYTIKSYTKNFNFLSTGYCYK